MLSRLVIAAVYAALYIVKRNQLTELDQFDYVGIFCDNMETMHRNERKSDKNGMDDARQK